MPDKQDFTIITGVPAAGNLFGTWCIGTVKSIIDNSAEFQSKDGRKSNLSAEDIAIFTENGSYKVGDKVWAIYEGESLLYEGLIKKTDGDKFLVAWVYDDEESEDTALLSPNEMINFNDLGKWQIQTLLETGTDVAARFDSGNWFKGTIENAENGEYLVVTYEGRQAYLDGSRIKVLTDKLNLSKGETVAALYGEEIFYGGTVQELEDGGAVIKWTDGTEPCFVPNAKIITGISDYDYIKQVYERPEDLISVNVNNSLFEVSRKTGRVYIDKSWVGDFDLNTFSLTAHSSYNASGKIEQNGNFYVMRGTSVSGYVTDAGEVYIGGQKIITLAKPSSGGTVYWNDMRLMALTMGVYLK